MGNFWWTVDEDMFTYVMKTKIEALINEKLNQEFPEEVEIREKQDYDSEEEMISETEETDDDESETNNTNVNNYFDSANMAMNLETAMKIAEEEDLWIGDSGASSHMMGSEEHVFAPSFIRMDLSIVSTSTSLTFPEFLVLFSSISLLFSFIESHFALSSPRCHL